MKHTQDMKPKTKFGRWLLDMMDRYNCSCGDVAKELGTTRQRVIQPRMFMKFGI